ncbi:heterokaryon incompatibility protein-domain-containing protein, partial [Podospora australis]
EALSYVWGSEYNLTPIYIKSDDGTNQHLLITENLRIALLHLRDPLLERVLWIDAICINQHDDQEKSHQVQSMANIYASASRVTVWLGEAGDDSDKALEMLRNAAEQQIGSSADTEKKQHQAVLALLRRPWFQRIWVLQEVAAARHTVIKCGLSEIDGYAFYLGLNALQLTYDAEFQGLIPSISYLLQGTVFRLRRQLNSVGKFSLGIRPLAELIDMYHTRKTTDPRDKVYALLGMCSDDPSSAGLVADYGPETTFDKVFQKVVEFSLSSQILVRNISVMHQAVALIQGKARILGHVSSRYQNSGSTSRDIVISGNQSCLGIEYQKSAMTILATVKDITEGDILCLLAGATKPSLIRPCIGYWELLAMAVPIPD